MDAVEQHLNILKQLRTNLANLKPIEKKVAIHQQAIEVSDPEPRRLEPLHEKVKRERSVIVELDTPRHLEMDAFVEGAKIIISRRCRYCHDGG